MNDIDGIRTMGASEARQSFSRLLDDAEAGHITMIIRHSRPVAAFMPIELLPLWELVRKHRHELDNKRIHG